MSKFNVYKVGSDYYNKEWFVTAKDKRTALKLVKDYTEDLGWHTSYPEEKRDFSATRMFSKINEVTEARDVY